ncbi:DsrE family protein [Psychrobacter pygoscelis]|uniref:DsrE family protein n=1 Tax=Psychrobacter pygoscelis TaxID=2488563 RepID=UPI00103CD5FE|nr:DsrE family protein [Psychrobacter pygoscelis]
MPLAQTSTKDNAILLLVTRDPSHPLAKHALRYAQALLELSNRDSTANDDTAHILKVFFYADGARTANGFNWQTADQLDITNGWQRLAERYNLALPVCVSTALARGISDTDNARRHKLKARLENHDLHDSSHEDGEKDDANKAVSSPSSNIKVHDSQQCGRLELSNLAARFSLVGLGELATLLSDAERVIQF